MYNDIKPNHKKAEKEVNLWGERWSEKALGRIYPLNKVVNYKREEDCRQRSAYQHTSQACEATACLGNHK